MSEHRTEYGLRLDYGPDGGDVIPIDDRRGDRLEGVAKAGKTVMVNGRPASLMVREIQYGEWGEVVGNSPDLARELASDGTSGFVQIRVASERAVPDNGQPVPTEYTLSFLAEGHPDWDTWRVLVTYRGEGRWAVLHRGRCLDTRIEWDYEPIPSERTDAWLHRHRFPLVEAMDMAVKALAKTQQRYVTRGEPS